MVGRIGLKPSKNSINLPDPTLIVWFRYQAVVLENKRP